MKKNKLLLILLLFIWVFAGQLFADEQERENRAAKICAKAEKTAYEKTENAADQISIKEQKTVDTADKISTEELKTENTWVEPVTGMEFMLVPGGCYMMGSNSGKSDEKPVHEVCLYEFWIGKYEVTQAEWKKIMKTNPSVFTKGDNYPVENISWNDAKLFIEKLNKKTNCMFRLPTESEWEYAAKKRKNSQTYPGGKDIDQYAWYDGNSDGTTHEVGTKAPNALGIYDMGGNVWEWCEDIYAWDAFKHARRTDPVFTGPGFRRVDRGGSWINFPGDVCCTRRDRYNPEDKSSNLGLRLVKEKSKKQKNKIEDKI
ncbi:MAG: formylglycine-generating enzyme family protein [Thermodesulfobacteriota bacterium]|nr:formylglycine-generating enzyme family protein [Thermodesulfobacteriota bacterium]